MNKLESLRLLENRGLNVHKYWVLDNHDKVDDIDTDKSYTARFDNRTGLIQMLPFEILDVGQYSLGDIHHLVEDAMQMGCHIILSDGRTYDPMMKYNIVYKIKPSGEFLMEWSDLKIPLRHMYKHPLNWVRGSLTTPLHWWDKWSGSGKLLDLHFVKQFISDEYVKCLFNKFVECTTYNSRVGKLNKSIIYWQV